MTVVWMGETQVIIIFLIFGCSLPNRVDQEHRLNNSNRRLGNKLWSGKMREVEGALVESCGWSSSFEK